MKNVTSSMSATALIAAAALGLVALAGRGAPARARPGAQTADSHAPLVLPALDRAVERLAAHARSHP